MLKKLSDWWRGLWAKPEPKVYRNDYGHGYTARELINGQWVLWHEGKAVDLFDTQFRWKPGFPCWRDCLGTREQVDAVARTVLAQQGVFKDEPPPET